MIKAFFSFESESMIYEVLPEPATANIIRLSNLSPPLYNPVHVLHVLRQQLISCFSFVIKHIIFCIRTK